MISSDLAISSVPSVFNDYNVVLLSTGVINVEVTNFNPSKSVALIAPTINFANTVTEAKGIFIADTVTLDTNSSPKKDSL